MQVWIPQCDGSGKLIKVLQEDIVLLSELFKRLNGEVTPGDPLATWKRHFFVKGMPAESFSRRARERLLPIIPIFGSADLLLNDAERPGPADRPWVSLLLRAEKAISVLITDSSAVFLEGTALTQPTAAPNSPPLRVRPPVKLSLLETLIQ